MTKEQEFLIRHVTAGLIIDTMEEYNLNEGAAMDVVYRSELFRKVEDVNTGVYLWSPDHAFEYLKGEIADKQTINEMKAF